MARGHGVDLAASPVEIAGISTFRSKGGDRAAQARAAARVARQPQKQRLMARFELPKSPGRAPAGSGWQIGGGAAQRVGGESYGR